MSENLPVSRPETARQLLALLLRSQWFADSLFSQIQQQSRDYLNFPALEFARALVEKRCLSAWHVSELLSGRFQFYRNELRFLDVIGRNPLQFVAEHGHASRLVLVEVHDEDLGCEDPDRADLVFEFTPGCLLSQLIHQNQFNSKLLNSWRGQIQRAVSDLDDSRLLDLCPERTSVDSSGVLRFWRPLSRGLAASMVTAESREQAFQRFDRFFQRAEEFLDSVFWSPDQCPIVPLSRLNYQHLLRKGPPLSTVCHRGSELNWKLPESRFPDSLPTEFSNVSEISNCVADQLQRDLREIADEPSNLRRTRNSSTSARPLWIAMTLLVGALAAAGWVWIRAESPRVRAGESPAEKIPQPSTRSAVN